MVMPGLITLGLVSTKSRAFTPASKKYNAKKGFNRLDYSITWQHGFSKNWSGYAEASYTMLENRVNNSPLVDANNSFQLATGVFYSF
ncbi:TPA: MipA/OmpV family protein [Klebsiella michiganensis]